VSNSQTIQESRWVGRVLRDKWRIDARIARGGMGTVFAATHKNNGSTAAIKILHPEFSHDSDTRSRFLQEGYAANQVNHPGVVRILDDDVTEEGLAYLVMELLEGELLEQRRVRNGGTLPLTEVYELASQLLDVLAAAHAKGIVHRDIKPGNIFVTSQGRLKVLDFGFAQMKTSFRTEQTATGLLLGTPGFMAPEQATGNRRLIDAQTDIWAVGATLFLLLTGEPVHAGDNAAEMLVAAATFPARSISVLEPGLPPKLAAAVDRALAFDKADRWPDARSMQTALSVVPGAPPALEPTFERSRWGHDRGEWRSGIPDDEPSPVQGAPIHDMTSMDRIEDLDDDLLASSGETRAYVRPTDRGPTTLSPAGEGRTIAATSSVVDRVAHDGLPNLGSFPTDATVIMESRPRPPGSFSGPVTRPSLPDASPPSRGSMPSYAASSPSRGSMPSYAGSDHPPQSVPSSVAGPIEPAAPRPERGGSKMLVLFLLGGITMLVVIMTGLIVILRSD
jgi:serine/threonine-protein kinase